MKEINYRCSCGAEISFADSRGSFAQPGGATDKKGRVYQIEIAFDRWLESHTPVCRANASNPLNDLNRPTRHTHEKGA